AGDQARSDGVADAGEDDRDGRGCGLRRLRRKRPESCNQHVRVVSNELLVVRAPSAFCARCSWRAFTLTEILVGAIAAPPVRPSRSNCPTWVKHTHDDTREFRDFLTCGVLAHGVARLRRTDC